MSVRSQAQERIKQLKIPGYGDDEVGFIADTMEFLRPQVVYEWGTNRGSSARIFWEISRLLKLNSQIVTCELADEHAHRDHAGQWTGMHLGPAKVTQLWGDGAAESLKHADEHPKKRVLIFIDGDHSFESVARELDLIHSALPHAWILLHDEQLPGVHRARFRYGGHYAVTILPSQAGMARLVPP